MWGIEIVVMLGMILINSILAAYEIALASVSLSRLQVYLRQNRAGAKSALYMKENLAGSFAVTQLGITLVGSVAAATAGAGAEGHIAPFLQAHLSMPPSITRFVSIASVVIPLSFFTIIFGELVPKVFALRNKEWVCLRYSSALRWVFISLWPLVWLLEAVVTNLTHWGERRLQSRLDVFVKSEATELQELRASVALARTSRLIGPQEEKIILSAAVLSQRPVKEVMLPASNIDLLNVNVTVADSLIAAYSNMHSRFPAAERAGDPQSIIGYVNFKDLTAPDLRTSEDSSLRTIVRPIHSFKDDSSIASCLQTLIHEQTHIALVRSPSNQILGMVTLEDMIEELVGEIEDEYDHLPVQAVSNGTGWLVGGGISLERIREVTGIDLSQDLPLTPVHNLSEWVIGHLQRPVKIKETLERGSVQVVVRKIRRLKVLEARIQRMDRISPVSRLGNK
jgi:putative hemolysin